MQSYADTGFGQLREAGAFPSRSAVLGIVAAALGVPRADDRLVALHEAFRVHVATARPGRVLKDYHTVETASHRPKTITWRDYHHDAHFVALVESGDEAAVEEAAAALRRPVYAAFLGRRSCPPATPLLPIVVEGDRFSALRETAEAARQAFPVTGETRWGGRRRAGAMLAFYLDDHLGKKDLPAAFARATVTHGTRRDLLVAPKRAYVNRPYTRLVLPLEADVRPNPNQDFFDAAS